MFEYYWSYNERLATYAKCQAEIYSMHSMWLSTITNSPSTSYRGADKSLA
jgi:hypothetical protein